MRRDPIEFPSDQVMLMLVAHAAGDTFTVRDGELSITVQSEERTLRAPLTALDDLEGRGWVCVLPDGRTELTDRGRYWCSRWLLARLGKGRLVSRVTGAKL